MGGEPLCPDNQFLTYMVINEVKNKYPDIKVYLWTGYTLDELKASNNVPRIKQILDQCEMVVDGRYEQELRDITLLMRGSTNQNIIKCNEIDWN